ncbi:protein PHLOEM PROTEIN 2-LIKE A10-like [Senna tora]|uniref:Protein PHLOEM PROTEIN 2-LIKE A10-like n=1 Tax=Senna tora TaxID=362788 RepID=A0A834ST49_9FABA|nr:protein PHLOEM PROTEIN 2-LIKE A10-like [Senna tora]
MEFHLVQKGFDYARKRKKWICLLAALGFTGYGAYRVYHAPSISRKRKKLIRLLGALISVAEAVSESADTIGIVSRDMKQFLQSDSDQIPNSLKQISKITRSREFSDCLVSITNALTLGVLRSYQSMNSTTTDGNRQIGDDDGSSLVDRMVDKLFAPAGSGFASVVVGSFARNLVLGFYSNGNSNGESNSNSNSSSSNSSLDPEPIPRWVNAVCGENCRDLIGNCVQVFVSTAVTVYLDKTMHINTYDDFFSGLTNPKHDIKVRDMLVFVCNNALETLVKTSHQVLTSPNQDSDEEKESGWVGKVSSTLAVPSNRRLVLDVTGRVTFETVRSFMEFVVEKFCACVRRCSDYVHEALLEILGYAAAKYSVIMTICLSLCLHIIGGAWAFVPA